MARARRSSGRRTDYAWNGGSLLMNNLTATKVVGGMVTVNQSSTLMRARGEIKAGLDGPTDGMVGAVGFGLIVGSDDQLAAGQTAFPSPVSDLDADWLWHGWILLHAFSATTNESFGAQHGTLSIDSKAMRKVRQNDQIILAAEVDVLSGSPAVDAVAAIRFLFGS